MSLRKALPALFGMATVLINTTPSFAQSGCAPALPQDICQLEDKIYTGTDFKNTEEVRGILVGLKKLLMSHSNDSAMIQDHLIGLVEHVVEESHEVRAPKEILAEAMGRPDLLGIHEKLVQYQEKRGPIVPLDWSLPPDFLYFVLTTTRGYSPIQDRTSFDFSVFAVLKSEDAVEQVQVIRYPNEVILDRQAGIGSWNNGHMGSARTPTFGLNADHLTTAPKEGLYLLNVKVKNKPMVNGWFVMSKTTPSKVPVVRSPSPNEALPTGNPTLRWLDFKSPEYRPFNQRKRKLHIFSRGSGSSELAWSSSVVYPDELESMQLSSAPNAIGMKELKNGNYALKAHFEERWFFGGLLIGRDAVTETPFSVAK